MLAERRLIFFPERPLVATPADLGLDFEDRRFRAADGARLHGWLVRGRRDTAVLWFHGNAGNVSHRVELLRDLHRELAMTILILEYRGYGESEGSPTESGLYLDAEAALSALVAATGLPAGRIVVLGQSLGAAVAVELATRRRLAGLILESAFTSVPEMARHHYPWLPLWPLLKTRFDSLSKITRVSAPLLLVHGDRDQIVPVQMAERLFAAAAEPKRMHVIQGGGHNDLVLLGSDEYFRALREFLAHVEASAAKRAPPAASQ
jgi:fermentation-respiration switch protein FrsA (DUF1100 family)